MSLAEIFLMLRLLTAPRCAAVFFWYCPCLIYLGRTFDAEVLSLPCTLFDLKRSLGSGSPSLCVRMYVQYVFHAFYKHSRRANAPPPLLPRSLVIYRAPFVKTLYVIQATSQAATSHRSPSNALINNDHRASLPSRSFSSVQKHTLILCASRLTLPQRLVRKTPECRGQQLDRHVPERKAHLFARSLLPVLSIFLFSARAIISSLAKAAAPLQVHQPMIFRGPANPQFIVWYMHMHTTECGLVPSLPLHPWL